MCTVPSPVCVLVEPGQTGKDSKKKSASKEAKKPKGSTEKKTTGSSVKEEVCFVCIYACTYRMCVLTYPMYSIRLQ